ncbi:MAG: PepSY domain-containing protein [Caulobacteraceae bacterium]|nr:PepSY domain-containing protein [Caulobacteraceae bacterium]
MAKRIALILALATLGGAAPLCAHAQGAPSNQGNPAPDSLGADWGPQQDAARAGVKQGRYVPLLKVIAEIRRRTPGRQLDAGLEQSGGRAVYRVRWATTDGRRIDYIVDAETGAILSAN